MGINRESEVAADLQIGPTSLGMVRLFIATDTVELPLDFEPDEAEEIAEERATARARLVGEGRAALSLSRDRAVRLGSGSRSWRGGRRDAGEALGQGRRRAPARGTGAASADLGIIGGQGMRPASSGRISSGKSGPTAQKTGRTNPR